MRRNTAGMIGLDGAIGKEYRRFTRPRDQSGVSSGTGMNMSIQEDHSVC